MNSQPLDFPTSSTLQSTPSPSQLLQQPHPPTSIRPKQNHHQPHIPSFASQHTPVHLPPHPLSLPPNRSPSTPSRLQNHHRPSSDGDSPTADLSRKPNSPYRTNPPKNPLHSLHSSPTASQIHSPPFAAASPPTSIASQHSSAPMSSQTLSTHPTPSFTSNTSPTSPRSTASSTHSTKPSQSDQISTPNPTNSLSSLQTPSTPLDPLSNDSSMELIDISATHPPNITVSRPFSRIQTSFPLSSPIFPHSLAPHHSNPANNPLHSLINPNTTSDAFIYEMLALHADSPSRSLLQPVCYTSNHTEEHENAYGSDGVWVDGGMREKSVQLDLIEKSNQNIDNSASETSSECSKATLDLLQAVYSSQPTAYTASTALAFQTFNNNTQFAALFPTEEESMRDHKPTRSELKLRQPLNHRSWSTSGRSTRAAPTLNNIAQYHPDPFLTNLSNSDPFPSQSTSTSTDGPKTMSTGTDLIPPTTSRNHNENNDESTSPSHPPLTPPSSNTFSDTTTNDPTYLPFCALTTPLPTQSCPSSSLPTTFFPNYSSLVSNSFNKYNWNISLNVPLTSPAISLFGGPKISKFYQPPHHSRHRISLAFLDEMYDYVDDYSRYSSQNSKNNADVDDTDIFSEDDTSSSHFTGLSFDHEAAHLAMVKYPTVSATTGVWPQVADFLSPDDDSELSITVKALNAGKELAQEEFAAWNVNNMKSMDENDNTMDNLDSNPSVNNTNPVTNTVATGNGSRLASNMNNTEDSNNSIMAVDIGGVNGISAKLDDFRWIYTKILTDPTIGDANLNNWVESSSQKSKTSDKDRNQTSHPLINPFNFDPFDPYTSRPQNYPKSGTFIQSLSFIGTSTADNLPPTSSSYQFPSQRQSQAQYQSQSQNQSNSHFSSTHQQSRSNLNTRAQYSQTRVLSDHTDPTSEIDDNDGHHSQHNTQSHEKRTRGRPRRTATTSHRSITPTTTHSNRFPGNPQAHQQHFGKSARLSRPDSYIIPLRKFKQDEPLAYLTRLHNFLTDPENSDIVQWDEFGTAFQITHQANFFNRIQATTGLAKPAFIANLHQLGFVYSDLVPHAYRDTYDYTNPFLPSKALPVFPQDLKQVMSANYFIIPIVFHHRYGLFHRDYPQLLQCIQPTPVQPCFNLCVEHSQIVQQFLKKMNRGKAIVDTSSSNVVTSTSIAKATNGKNENTTFQKKNKAGDDVEDVNDVNTNDVTGTNTMNDNNLANNSTNNNINQSNQTANLSFSLYDPTDNSRQVVLGPTIADWFAARKEQLGIRQYQARSPRDHLFDLAFVTMCIDIKFSPDGFDFDFADAQEAQIYDLIFNEPVIAAFKAKYIDILNRDPFQTIVYSPLLERLDKSINNAQNNNNNNNNNTNGPEIKAYPITASASAVLTPNSQDHQQLLAQINPVLAQLFNIVQDISIDWIQWDAEGTSFFIFNSPIFRLFCHHLLGGFEAVSALLKKYGFKMTTSTADDFVLTGEDGNNNPNNVDDLNGYDNNHGNSAFSPAISDSTHPNNPIMKPNGMFYPALIVSRAHDNFFQRNQPHLLASILIVGTNAWWAQFDSSIGDTSQRTTRSGTPVTTRTSRPTRRTGKAIDTNTNANANTNDTNTQNTQHSPPKQTKRFQQQEIQPQQEQEEQQERKNQQSLLQTQPPQRSKHNRSRRYEQSEGEQSISRQRDRSHLFNADLKTPGTPNSSIEKKSSLSSNLAAEDLDRQ